MEEKKKFQKPSMKVVELKSKARILAGSGCDSHCDPHCPIYDEQELCFMHQ